MISAHDWPRLTPPFGLPDCPGFHVCGRFLAALFCAIFLALGLTVNLPHHHQYNSYRRHEQRRPERDTRRAFDARHDALAPDALRFGF